MTKFLQQLSISRKLSSILLLSSALSVIISGLSLMVLEITAFQKNTRNDLAVLAQIIGHRSSAALTFGDQHIAEENLQQLNNMPIIKASCFYDAQGAVFAKARKNTEVHWNCPQLLESLATHLENTHLIIVEHIVESDALIGSVYIHADLSAGYWQKLKFCGLVLLILIVVSMVAFFLSMYYLKKLISGPVEKLVTTVNLISDTQDFSLRAEKVNDQELNLLVVAFNTLITTVESQNNALLQAKDRYLALFDNNPTMVFNLDDRGMILSINHTAAYHLNAAPRDLLKRVIFDVVHIDDLLLPRELFKQCLENPTQAYKRDFRMICCDERIIWVRATCKKILNNANGGSFLLVCEDITEARILSEKITYQANHDALTGLGNRSQFELHIKQALSTAQNNQVSHALCFLDLDQFKIVNDTCGHLAGDELLRQLGGLFKHNIRRHDFVARLGGDEFGILMNDCGVNKALSICEKLRDRVRDFNFAWEDRRFVVGVSIGIAAINMTSSNVVDVMKEADTACYIAKGKGRNRVHVHRPDDVALAQRQGEMQWVEKIQKGLAENRFFLYGQPIVAIGHGEEGLHFETLVRYRDDSGRLVPPGAFLPATERYGLAADLDRWVIATLFEWMAKKPGFVQRLSVCSVNLSGISMSDETMLAFIFGQFDRWKIPPNKICFEVTETAAIGNLSFATNFIHQLQFKGCLFSLDDFGSGLSSFAYLKNLPVDYLKIDGLFVKDILEDEIDLAMVKSINEVGHVMKKKTIAEFVENEAIFNKLKALGVDYAQGYGISKPVPLDELTRIKPFSTPSK